MAIGINIGCFLPGLCFPGGLRWAADSTKEIGATFWQVLPARNIDMTGIGRVGYPVRFAEPWNPITFWDKLCGRPGAEGAAAKWQDVILFPNPVTAGQRFQEILRDPAVRPIYNRIETAKHGGLVEISSGFGLTAGRLAQYAEWGIYNSPPTTPQPPAKIYVLDTCHLREEPKLGPNCLHPWEGAIRTLLPYLALVHVQPLDGEELRATLDGAPTELIQMLKLIKSLGYEGDYVLEVPPNLLGVSYFLNPKRMVRTLTQFRERVENILSA